MQRVKRSAGGGGAGTYTEDHDQATVVTKHGAQQVGETHPDHNAEELDQQNTIIEDDEEEGDAPMDDGEIEVDVDEDGDGNRVKRFTTRQSSVWPRGLVPYVLMDNLGDHYRKEALAAMGMYHKYTCIRFVPWVAGETMQQYGLTEESHVNIEKRGDHYHHFYCKAVQGNVHNANGQWNSCCNRTVCLHELGHSMGIIHEHQSPLRSDYLQVIRRKLQQSQTPWYKVNWLPPYTDSAVMQHYDMSSRMHYSSRSVYHSLYEELKPVIGGKNMFYVFRDLTIYTQCGDHYCANNSIECHNDGFLTLVDDQCSCLCPPGLDASTGCTTTISQADTGTTWPGESFAMFSPLSGCPGSLVFDTGSWQHKGAGSNVKSSEFHLTGSYESDVFRYSFCVKDQTSDTTTATTWESGRYCFLRAGGTCPDGFQTGHLQYDDADDSQGQAEGQLPDGVFVDGTDTRLEFCCRDDGMVSTPLTALPNAQPLTLLQTAQGGSCQEVAGMSWTEEYMWFKSLSGTPSMGGSHPRVSDGSTFKLYFCHYVPVNLDCGGAITLTASNPQVVISSPNYPLAYDTNLECNWLIKAEDPSGQVLLNFHHFQLTTASYGCQDTLEIRHNLPGQPGLRYCGDGMGRTIRSINNIIILTLRSDYNKVTSDVGFNVTASLYSPDDSCYEPSSKGAFYRGSKNYTRGMRPCLAWKDVGTCRYHALHPRDFAKGLDDNYCRNPDNTAMPWCYTTPDCERDYCDVCNVERVYDRSAYCDERRCGKSVDTVVKEGCAGTCGLQHPTTPVRATQCSQPEVPADATMVDPQSFTGPLPVGSTVSLRCSSGTERFNLTCLSDGSWTRAGFVCGACSDGWAFFNGSCYRYFALQKYFQEARDHCASHGAVVAPMKNAQEMEFVSLLRLHLFRMWIGATDSEVEGQWRWEDGTEVTWSNWLQDGATPRVESSSRDCVKVEVDINDVTWQDYWCHWQRLPFVCKYSVSERSICVDRRQDCVSTLMTSPATCSQSPAYGDQMCAYTCGLCQPDATPACDVPATSSDVTVVSPLDQGSVSRGQEVRYACAEGLVLSSGQLTQACGADGNLIGSTPVCEHPDYVTQDSNDVSLQARPYNGWGGYVYVGVGSRWVIARNGVVKQWKFYSDHAGHVFFQVWRPQASDSSLMFVGQNQVLSSGTGEQTVDVGQADWIQVQPGDTLALYESWAPRAYVPYSSCSSEDLDVLRATSSVSFADFFPSEIRTFASRGCREFSFKAVIHPVDSIPDSPDVATSQVGVVSRWWEPWARYAYLGDSANFRVPAQGYVKQWQFFAKHAGVGAFQLWRKRPDRGTGKFQLLGQINVNITSDEERMYTIEVPEGERIAVQAGDLIGVVSGEQRFGLAFYLCRSGYTGGDNIYRLSSLTPDVTFTGDVYTFSHTTSCYVYSLRAIVQQAPVTPPPPPPTVVRTSDMALVHRGYRGSHRKVYLAHGHYYLIPADGRVKEWQFFSVYAGNGAFQVWRASDTGERRYELVGQNEVAITSDEDRPYTLPVPEAERIAVKAGDVIGFLYGESNKLGLVYSLCSEDEDFAGSSNVSTYYPLTPDTAVVGNVYDFTDSSSCRVFSFRAVVELELVQENTADDHNAVTEEGAVTQAEATTTALPPGIWTSYEALVDRPEVPPNGRVFLGLSEAFRVPVSGDVIEWQFFFKYPGSGHFQIWRPREGAGQFEFIGQNPINLTSEEAGIYRHQIPSGERIAVNAGDLVGFWYGEDGLGLPFSFCSGAHETQYSNNIARLTPSGSLVAGTVYSFTYNSGTFACRVFSYRAVIEPATCG